MAFEFLQFKQFPHGDFVEAFSQTPSAQTRTLSSDAEARVFFCREAATEGGHDLHANVLSCLAGESAF